MAADSNDPNGYFHHNPNISDYNDRYQLQYYTLVGLEDLNQENATIDSYLKTAIHQFQTHGADGFRLDAIKHVTWGWEYSLANSVFNQSPSFLFGEWYNNNPSDPLYHDAYKFADKSAIGELHLGVNTAVRQVFARNNNFSGMDSIVSAASSSFSWYQALFPFFASPSHATPLT